MTSHKFWENGKHVMLFICVSHFLRLKKNIDSQGKHTVEGNLNLNIK